MIIKKHSALCNEYHVKTELWFHTIRLYFTILHHIQRGNVLKLLIVLLTET